MKVQNMTSNKGNKIANQFIISDSIINLPEDHYQGDMFQSYDSNIVFKSVRSGDNGNSLKVFIDEKYWDYSVTTGKYRNQFLGETKKETQAKIDNGEYILTNLNY